MVLINYTTAHKKSINDYENLIKWFPNCIIPFLENWKKKKKRLSVNNKLKTENDEIERGKQKMKKRNILSSLISLEGSFFPSLKEKWERKTRKGKDLNISFELIENS